MKSLLLAMLIGLMMVGCGEEAQKEAVQEEAPKEASFAIKPGENFTIPDLGLEMLWVKPGTFMMGSPESEKGRSNETQHQVTLTDGFYLGKHEVTQAQWERVMGSNPSLFKGADRPVEEVSWDDAVEFCKKLTETERRAGRLPAGMAYQLPTEAQWEYACRAGARSAYSFGGVSGELYRYANYADRNTDYDWSDKSHDDGFENTSPVGNYPANPWGFHDMHGNVYEWCADWHDTYPSGSVTNPEGPASGSTRVPRGGSWLNDGTNLRSAKRSGDTPSYRNYTLGFRVGFLPSK
jgi:formylglycine-generating enzyme required for sulfatase activity